MRFTWDPNKSERTRLERGFDFDFASASFAGRTVEWDDVRRDYGERRIVAVGATRGRILTICYTDRMQAGEHVERRIISARRSNPREKKSYAAGGENG
ncbi:MAG: BrnT family toxin [Gemmatimonadota bacterium]